MQKKGREKNDTDAVGVSFADKCAKRIYITCDCELRFQF